MPIPFDFIIEAPPSSSFDGYAVCYEDSTGVHEYKAAILADGSIPMSGELNLAENNIINGGTADFDLVEIRPSGPFQYVPWDSSDILRLQRNGDISIHLNSNGVDLQRIMFSDTAIGRGRVAYDHSSDTMSLYSAGVLNFYLDISGHPFFPNARISTGGVAARLLGSGELIGQSSSRRFKENERRLNFSAVEVILNMPTPVLFDYRDVVHIDPDTGERRITPGDKNTWGWIAEDLIGTPAERLLYRDDKGQEFGIRDGYQLLSLLVETVKVLELRIRKLEGG